MKRRDKKRETTTVEAVTEEATVAPTEATEAAEGEETPKTDETTEAGGDAPDATEEAPEGEETPKKSKSVVPKKYQERYKSQKGKCGDEMSALVSDWLFVGEAFDNDRFEQLCSDNGIEKRWEGRNTGMKRMNVGNVLRGKLRNGVPVKIGDKIVNGDGSVTTVGEMPEDDETEEAATENAA